MSHVRLLRFLAGPADYAAEVGVELETNRSGGLGIHVERVFPEWEEEFYVRLVGDLDRMGLSQAGSALRTMMTARGTLEPRISPFGRRFLAFVTHPLEG